MRASMRAYFKRQLNSQGCYINRFSFWKAQLA